ncbi:MAG: hypothetical protein U0704_02635 [Candidatus Eisenbacteria bacterium]
MKRGALLLLLAAMTFFAVPAQAQRDFLCGYTGFDFVVSESPHGGPFLANGDEYRAVGFVTSFSTMFNGVTGAGEHTFYLSGATVASSSFVGNVLEVTFDPHARFRIYEDAANNGSYGVNPPNGTVPSTFIDGTLFLGADVNSLVLVYDYNDNSGNFEGLATLDEGSALWVVAPSRRAGWVLGGQAGQPNGSVPAGYVNQVNGEMQIPSAVPAAHKTWGQLKTLYR